MEVRGVVGGRREGFPSFDEKRKRKRRRDGREGRGGGKRGWKQLCHSEGRDEEREKKRGGAVPGGGHPGGEGGTSKALE